MSERLHSEFVKAKTRRTLSLPRMSAVLHFGRRFLDCDAPAKQMQNAECLNDCIVNTLKQRLDAPCRFLECPRSCTSLYTFINHNVPAKHMQNIACLSNVPMSVVCLKETDRYVGADWLALWCQLNLLYAFANADQNAPTCSARAIWKTGALMSGSELFGGSRFLQ
jgi:hypothetical protein